MSKPLEEMFGLLKKSPGLTLVILGFSTIYFIVHLSGSGTSFIPLYLSIGFAFIISLAGIVLIFRELKFVGSIEVGTTIISTDLEHAVNQLGKNYDILRRQATQGFVLAGTFMALGICVILAGSVGELFGLTTQGSNLTTIAGVVVEVISGMGLYLFKETFKQLNTISDKLHSTWKILAAFKKAETLPDPQKTTVITELIAKLVDVKIETTNI